MFGADRSPERLSQFFCLPSIQAQLASNVLNIFDAVFCKLFIVNLSRLDPLKYVFAPTATVAIGRPGLRIAFHFANSSFCVLYSEV